MTCKTYTPDDHSPAAAAARRDTWRAYVATLLAREPRGFRDVAAFSAAHRPAVIRVASCVEGKPFPTLYWLVDPELNLALDRFEAAGAIAMLQQWVDDSPAVQRSMAADHDRHKNHRDAFLSTDERELLLAHNRLAALAERGIGGIGETDRIRCLHTWYAAHCIDSNTIGAVLDTWLDHTGGVPEYVCLDELMALL